jgi:hypothetical protein
LAPFIPHRNVEKENKRKYELYFVSKKKLSSTVTRYEFREPNDYQTRQGVIQVLGLVEGFGNPPPPLLEVKYILDCGPILILNLFLLFMIFFAVKFSEACISSTRH